MTFDRPVTVRLSVRPQHLTSNFRMAPRVVEAPVGVPPGFRAEDYLGLPELEGDVTIPEAAERMGVTGEEIIRMAMRFLLAYRVVGARVYVRPAIVEMR